LHAARHEAPCGSREKASLSPLARLFLGSPGGIAVHFVVFQDMSDVWRWRLFSKERRAIAESCGDGFPDRAKCEASLDLVRATNGGTPIEHVK
jgi:uncharacterized protein YegP (UPF0339 family)